MDYYVAMSEEGVPRAVWATHLLCEAYFGPRKSDLTRMRFFPLRRFGSEDRDAIGYIAEQEGFDYGNDKDPRERTYRVSGPFERPDSSQLEPLDVIEGSAAVRWFAMYGPAVSAADVADTWDGD